MLQNVERTLGDIFDNPVKGEKESFLQIPRFQRKYEWDKQYEVLRLIDDVYDNLGRNYFMGPLIFCSRDEGSVLEIIDGQQRLITFAIFYRALADYIRTRRDAGAFTEESLQYAEQIQTTMRDRIAKGWMKKRYAVLRLSKTIDKYFRDNIVLNEDPNKVDKIVATSKGEHPSARKLAGAYEKIYRTLKDKYDSLSSEELLEALSKVGESLEYRQIFLTITVQNYSDAYTIFETMNERGKRLALSDLVKNLCFKKLAGLGDELLDEFENDWDEADLLVSNFGSFMWHAWISRFGSCSKANVFKEMEAHIDRMNSDQVWDFASGLVFDESKWYHLYENPREILEDKGDIARSDYLEQLRIMGATRCYPLLLSVDYALEKAKSITVKDAAEIIKTISCLTFWHNGICENDAKPLEKIYHELAKQVRAMRSDEREKNVAKVLAKLRSVFPTMSQCKADFYTKSFSNDSLIRMILSNIELHCNPGEKTLLSSKVVWLEHILPRNPAIGGVWMELFPDENERKEYAYKLGNYTLLLNKLNEKARNYSFTKKKDIYKDSHVELTLGLLDFQKWDKDTIDKRTEMLFEFAVSIWPIYSP